MARKPEKIPIYDEDAEVGVIGAVIVDPSCLKDVDLDPQDFFDEDRAQVWGAILSLRDRGSEITEASVIKELAGAVKGWVVTRAVAEALPSEVLHQLEVVQEKSRQRKLVATIEGAMKELRKEKITSQDLVDKILLCINTLDFPTNSSRVIAVTNPRILDDRPPTYELTVSTVDGKASDRIKITSAELDKPAAFRRKVREHLKVSPFLPKQYETFVHQILQQAEVTPGAGDASFDETVCYWVREWFNAASEAESKDDLVQGYVERDGAYWYLAERLIGHVADRAKIKFDRSSLSAVLNERGGRPSKMVSVGGKKTRLWGIDKSFFEEDDLSWLEEEG